MSAPEQNLPHSAETASAGQGEARRRSVFARLVRFCTEIVAFVVAVAVIVVGIVGWRLSTAPLSLDFLTPYVEQAMTPSDRAFSVKVDQTELIWAGWERNLDVRVKGAKILGPDGALIAEVSDVAIKFSFRALARGILAPTVIEIRRPAVRVLRTESGAIELGLGQSGAQSGNILQGLLANITGTQGSGPLAYLNSFSMTGASLEVEDRSLGLFWTVDSADIAVLRTREGLDARLQFAVEMGSDRPKFDLNLAYAEASQELAADLVFSQIRPRSYASRIPGLAGLEPIDIPVTGRLTTKFDVASVASNAVAFDQLAFTLSGEDGTLRVGGTALYSDVPLRHMAARGTLNVRDRQLRVDAIEVGLVGGANLALAGWVQQVEDRIAFAAQLRLAGLSAPDLSRFWPYQAKTDARDWVTANIREGRIDDGQVDVAGSIGQGQTQDVRIETLQGSYGYTGLQVSYFSPLPPIRGIRGRGSFDTKTMTFTVEQGEVNGLRVEGGVVRITDLGAPVEPLSVDTIVKGPIARVLEILDTQPLRFASAVGIAPSTVAGTAAARLAFRLPLISSIKLSELRFSAAANLADVGIRRALGNFDLKAEALSLVLDGAGLEVKGNATIGPLSGAIVWNESFGEGVEYRSRYQYRGPVTAPAQRAIGIELAPFLRGDVGADLAYGVRRNGTADLSGTVDLSPSELALDVLGWKKAAGTRGQAWFSAALQSGALRSLPTLSVDADGLKLSANGQFLPDGKGLDELRIESLRVGRNDAKAVIRPRPAGVTEILLQGGTIDLAPYLDAPTPENAEKDPPLAIGGNLDTIWLAPDQKVERVAGRALRDGEDWQQAELRGQLTESGEFAITLKPEGAGRDLVMNATNAGAMLRAAGVFKNMIGGTLQVNGRFDSRRADSTFVGRVEIADYRVVDAPVMARLLASASLRGPLELLTSEGIGFSRLTAPFKYEARRLTVERSRAYGASLGINALGHIDFKANTVSLTGTIVPIYTVNRILGSIPIIGSILTGGEGEGVFAVTYRLEGPIDDPQITVNPLSALAPGFLRNLFGLIEGPEPTFPQLDSQP